MFMRSVVMRKESKSPVFFALSLMLGFALLVPQLEARTTTANNAHLRQSVTNYSPGQPVIARVTVRNSDELDLLIASGVNLLEGHKNEDVFVLTTFGKMEELRNQDWPVTLLYVRGVDSSSNWQYVEAPSGGCTSSIAPTQKSFTGAGGAQNFDLTTGASCEWVVFADSPWIHVNGIGQGTGSATISYGVDANGTSSNRVGHIFVEGQVFTVYQGVQFNDVPPGHSFYLEIGILSARGVTVGCGGGNYCPSSNVTREQMAAFIIRALGVFNPPPPAMQRFNDVPPSNQFYAFIEEMAVRQITVGCGGGNYCPAAAVTREQMAAFIIRGIGEFNPPTPSMQRFNDVPPSNPFYNFIDRMAALGITSGCSANPPLYCPGASTTRGQMAVFLVRAFDL